EVVDPEGISGSDRSDVDHFARDGGRMPAPTTILQVHVPTATGEGTLAALADHYRSLADRVRSGEQLAPDDEIWLGYDAVELMPVEPTITFETGPPVFAVDAHGHRATVTARRPDTTNWGYDVVIAGGAAVNPAMLRTGRPHELAELAEVLHGFPGGPIALVLDVVYGHADNQGVSVLPGAWLTGPDMYGQHLDYRNEVVRTHLLEMQRRKADHGADALRVDGAQDFTWWESGIAHYHDEYMEEMSAVTQRIGPHAYRPFMIFEDGRPWPRPDWELASTYRAVIERQDHVVQWGPLTFAHNTPFLFTFWAQKWWRMREIADMGSRWVSGCSNHDTLRRGSQVDPARPVNSFLGATLPEIIERAYDHPASILLFHGFLPGIPMDFVQANARAPWSFIRNVDFRYAVKVWAEEHRFLEWRVTPERYRAPDAFPRLKTLGFDDLEALSAYMRVLASAVDLVGDAVGPLPDMMRAGGATDPDPTVGFLRTAARAWMDDVHDYCVVDRWSPEPGVARMARRIREFRLANPWLRSDLRADDEFDHRHPTRGTMLVIGTRSSPDGNHEVAIAANLEGRRVDVALTDLVDDPSEWRVVATAPRARLAMDEVRLPDATGILLERSR
ncbi:MAG: glucosylglycerol hydrolase, partial [Acidimicrobiia bacterium]|nr:glucosylglycerol hydrolase [Acidimicrobiia bacterium]